MKQQKSDVGEFKYEATEPSDIDCFVDVCVFAHCENCTKCVWIEWGGMLS
jgi:hypothetical protein